tara:strand:- start:2351 stop:5362 length:3012 start_codon:yes stop_codon:yes gene_type:complete
LEIKKVLPVLIYFYTLLFSQSFTVKGIVKDKKTQKSLIGANVFIVGSSIGTSTDTDGKYRLSNVQLGSYKLKASYIGYQEVEVDITVTSTENITQDFELSYVSLEGEAIEVTAQAKGQIDAINKQIKAKSIKNIVSSDRIQELPDANAAETVARIPGVSIRREGGEGNKVIIRGLSPKYNKVMVDGTNLASTDPDNRSTDLSMISQYMLEGIEVTKAGTPDQEGDVLGGTVNFKLKKAPSGFHGNFVTQGMQNGLQKTNDDYKLVGSVSNRFFSDRLGTLVSLDAEKRNRSSHNLRSSYENSPAELDSINQLQLNSLVLSDNHRINNRFNTLYVLDFALPKMNISYSGLHSSIDKDVVVYENQYGLSGDDQRNYNSGQTPNTISVITETWKLDREILPNLNFDMGYSFSKSVNGDTSKIYQFRERYAYTENVMNKSLFGIQDFTVNDTAGTWFENYNYYERATTEKEQSFNANLAYDFTLNSQLSGKLKMGMKLRNKSRAFDYDYEYCTFTYVGQNEKRDSTYQHFEWLNNIPLGTIYPPYGPFMDKDYSDAGFLGGDYRMGPFADLDKMNQIFSFFKQNYTYDPYHENIFHHYHKTESLIYDYSGTEKYNASYIMTDLNIGSKINIVTGIRFENNKTTYTSYHGMQTTLPHFNSMGSDTVFSYTRNNSYSLPSIFLKYDFTDWLTFRYAGTKTLTRPDYADIIPLYNISGGSGSVTYRNPFLEPGVSRNRDYVMTFYENRLGLLSFSYFTKNISDLIYSSGRRFITDPSLYGLPNYTEKYQIIDYKSNNPYEVLLNGFEIDYQTRFWYLPNLFRGLVFNANYTRTESEVKYPRTIIEQELIFVPSLQVIYSNVDSFYVDRLLDQPKDIINLSLGYDYKGFSGRLSMMYISDVFKTTNFWPELRESTDAYRRYDLSLKQELPVDGLELFLNISNLNEAIDVNRLRGFNRADPDFTNCIYEDITSNSLEASAVERLDMIPRNARAKSLEQHYGQTIDLGFRFAF